MTDGSDEPWGVLALASCLVFIPWARLKMKVPTDLLVLVFLAQLCYQVLIMNWAPLLRALFAVATIALVLLRMRTPAGIMGLLCLSLPWIATLQFYLGFPLRVFTGEVTKWLLNAVGMGVQREGIILLWNSQQVVVDRPCAGVYMLWFGAYLSYLLACVYQMTFQQCILLGMRSFLVILLANILRNLVLFFLETGIVEAPAFAHESVGILLFVLAVGLLAKITETRVSERTLRSAE